MIDHYRSDERIERVHDGTLHKEMKSKRIGQLLAHVRDIPKLISILLYKKLSPSTFIKLRATLATAFDHQFLLEELGRL